MNTRSRIQAGTFRYVAPIGTGDLPNRVIGRADKKPWDYPICAAIPHIETVESLQVCIELLRAQTIRPYILVVDTGSSPDTISILESMRDEDLEVHYVAGHGYNHSSEPVCAALDLAQSMCRSKHLFHIHSDCFLRRQDFLENISRICNSNTPVVGYRMSPREWAAPVWPSRDWTWMVGHVATMTYLPSIHRSGATWSMQRAFYQYGYAFNIAMGWPDTEVAWNHAIRDAGIRPIFLGNDRNNERYIDDNIDHPRSYPGTKIYGRDSEYYRNSEDWMIQAIKDARERLLQWETTTSIGTKCSF